MILRLKCKKCGTGYSFKSKWVSNPYFETVEAWSRRCEK
nr:MAG TPA: zinc-ribbon domain protein [Caudoviricetes sp.]